MPLKPEFFMSLSRLAFKMKLLRLLAERKKCKYSGHFPPLCSEWTKMKINEKDKTKRF